MLLTAAVLAFVPNAGEAKTLYVDGTSGNDSVSYASNGPTAPWRTIGRAAWGSSNRGTPNSAEAARAGDTVRIAAGTYVTAATNVRFDPAYNPVNSGTAGNPIRFEGIGSVVLTFSSGTGPMIGANLRNYIQWSGFTISESTAPTRGDTGPVTFLGSTGSSIESSTLVGNPNWTARVGDNYNGVRLEDSPHTHIYNNTIRDYGRYTGDENHSCVTNYRSFPVTIEYNRFFNCGAGIYEKGLNLTTPGVNALTTRYNIFENNQWGIRVLLRPMTQALPLLIYQNIFKGNTFGVWVHAFDNGTGNARWVRVFNNTFVDNTSAGYATYNHDVWPASSNLLAQNNIIYGGQYSVLIGTSNIATNTTKDRIDLDRNLYTAWSVNFGELQGASRSLAYWQGLNSQDANSLVANPLFINYAAGDYRLQAGSPARTLGRVLHGIGGPSGSSIPVGAYITGQELIGPTGGTPPIVPVPTNLRIISP